MKAASKEFFVSFARLCALHNLAFFFLLLICSCSNSTDVPALKIIWKNGKAVALQIQNEQIEKFSNDSLSTYLKISIKSSQFPTPILGYLIQDPNIIFEPLVPFTFGSSYEVRYKNELIGTFNIPLADVHQFPELLAIYPLLDTLPENVLKLYLAFSHPMQEGTSYEYLSLTRNEADTVEAAFLDLQTELWNEGRTVLTVWFDPGRIKRALQPNLKMGAPLTASSKYKITVSRSWKDASGVPLQKNFTKYFVAALRDSTSPVPDHWRLRLPKLNSLDTLTIQADETLDHFLFAECLHLKNEQGSQIKGVFQIDHDDKTCHFIPSNEWSPGKYVLSIESRLEDLAGNNLNRPFDRDITQTSEQVFKPAYDLRFELQPSMRNQ